MITELVTKAHYPLSIISCHAGRKRVEHQERNVPGSTTNLGEGELHTPHLTLVAETVLANELQLSVPAFPTS